MSDLSVPQWPTAKRGSLSGGRLLGVDGSMWLYRRAPMGPMVDARGPEAALASAAPLHQVLEELAALGSARVARRALARSRYRAVHVLSLDVPAWYRPPASHPLRDHLARSFAGAQVRQRLTLVGVKLTAHLGGGGLRQAIASVAETLAVAGTPIEDFEDDYRKVDDVMARAGMGVPTTTELWLADSWWDAGRRPDVGILEHLDHLHVFSEASAMAEAENLPPDCSGWADIPGQHSVSFFAGANFELPFVEESEPAARWVPVLFDMGALAVSLRGLLEPPAVTRNELRRVRKQYIDDVNERATQGKMSRSEQEETLAALTDMEALYATGGPGTLVDASVVVAVSGQDRDGRLPAVARDYGFELLPMTNRQRRALAECWVTSHVRANPHLEDLPVHVVSSSGLTSLSVVGDQTGALLGFTERDRQPAYISPTAAADIDSVPAMVVAGQSGSGKATRLSTRVPTPTGWTKMGDLALGDWVFGRDGKPCRVVFLSDIIAKPDLYRVRFDDGQEVYADAEHQWLVSESDAPGRERVVTTAQIIAEGPSRSMVRLPKALELPEARLPVHPQALGTALAEGHLWEGANGSRWRCSAPFLLSQAGAGPDERIPLAYLRSEASQRLALLDGLMSVAGSEAPAGGCELVLADEGLAQDAVDLVRSLGIKAQVQQEQTADGRTLWRTRFDMRSTREDWLYITSIEPVEPEPARCIQVDSPDSTYLVEGFVPTHNTMAMVHLAVQFAQIPTAKGERTPTIILDPKMGSDLGPVVRAAGGQVASLDDLVSGDGVFDPLRFAANKVVAQDLATNLLLAINPWGRARADFEAPLASAIGYGIQAGATCIGEALALALQSGEANEALVKPVADLAKVSPLFRACVGTEPGTTGLRMAEGLTLIKAGDTYLDLSPSADPTLGQRVAAALVRMMVFGSAMALSGRQGVLMVDEAWVVLQAGLSEVERLGRVARSQQVFPVLFTQRVTDAVKAGMAGYISRGLVMAFTDVEEAKAGCELFRLEPTPERLERMLAKDTIGDGQEQAPNWASMRALRDGPGGKTLRGALAIYVDLAGRAVLTEVAIPNEVLRLASTNPEDIRRRQAG